MKRLACFSPRCPMRCARITAPRFCFIQQFLFVILSLLRACAMLLSTLIERREESKANRRRSENENESSNAAVWRGFTRFNRLARLARLARPLPQFNLASSESLASQFDLLPSASRRCVISPGATARITCLFALRASPLLRCLDWTCPLALFFVQIRLRILAVLPDADKKRTARDRTTKANAQCRQQNSI